MSAPVFFELPLNSDAITGPSADFATSGRALCTTHFLGLVFRCGGTMVNSDLGSRSSSLVLSILAVGQAWSGQAHPLGREWTTGDSDTIEENSRSRLTLRA